MYYAQNLTGLLNNHLELLLGILMSFSRTKSRTVSELFMRRHIYHSDMIYRQCDLIIPYKGLESMCQTMAEILNFLSDLKKKIKKLCIQIDLKKK